MAAAFGVAVRATSVAAEAVTGQDIVVTTTPSRTPVVKREWVSPGTHINAIGADAAGKQELAPAILTAAKVVVDDWAQASHSGEINVALARGELTPDRNLRLFGGHRGREEAGAGGSRRNHRV